MRVRLVRPGFWSDARMAALSIPVRLTYIGLWCLADDAGVFIWDAREIAAELYRFEGVKHRERAVIDHLDALLTAGRVELLDCRRHARIPTLPTHRIKGGEQSYGIQARHQQQCATSEDVALRSTTSEDIGIHRTTSHSVSDSYTDSDSDSDSASLSQRAREDAPQDNGLPHIDEETRLLVERLTGRTLLQSGQRQLTELDRLIEDHGSPAVREALERIAAGSERPLTARQLVWPAMKLLEPMPSGKDPAQAEVEQERSKGDDRILEQMHRRRLEWYHQSGKWPADWGAPPAQQYDDLGQPVAPHG